TMWPRDWSSDVCSSDLDHWVSPARLGFVGDYGLSPVVITGDKWHGESRHPVRRIFRSEHGKNGERARAVLETISDRGCHRSHEKIGRASCRERVMVAET